MPTIVNRTLESWNDAVTSTVQPGAGDSDEDSTLINNRFMQIFFCVFYSTVFVLGVVGNMLVCWVVLRNKAMHTVTNYFITNLALSDILLCILAVPFTPLYTFLGSWVFGRWLCHMVSFAQGCSIYISTLTLTSIAVDRYFVIIYPFKPRMKLSTCAIIIAVIWVVSLLATLPYGMYMRVTSSESYLTDESATPNGNLTNRTHTNDTLAYHSVSTELPTDVTTEILASSTGVWQPNSTAATLMSVLISSSTAPTTTMDVSYCEENWPSEKYRKVFGSVTSICQFVLPFFIMAICYTVVSLKLNERARSKPGSKSSRREEADRDRKRRTNRMLITMVFVFLTCWLPLNLINIADDFYENSNNGPYYLLFFMAHSIAMSSTCYNPFVYAWLNDNFRKEFKQLLPFLYSSNHFVNLNRGYNRSERNTCGPRLRHGDGGDGSLDADDVENGGVTKIDDHKLIIPREPTYGNGCSSGALSPCLGPNTLAQHSLVDLTVNERKVRRRRRDSVDSGEEQTVEMRFCETPFVSSDNTTAISMLESSTFNDFERRPN